MVEYYKGDEAKLSLELRWMGIVIRRVKTLPHEDKRETQERLNMMVKDSRMRIIYEETEARTRAKGYNKGFEKGYNEGLRIGIVKVVSASFPDLKKRAQQTVAQINKPEKLKLLLILILKASDEDVVRSLLDLVAA